MLPVDFSDIKSIRAMVAKLRSSSLSGEGTGGGIDILICNAGTNGPTPLSDLSAEGRARFRHIIDVNLTGTVFLAQLACAHMPPATRCASVR